MTASCPSASPALTPAFAARPSWGRAACPERFAPTSDTPYAPLEAERHSVLAMIRCADQHTAIAVDPDRLRAADREIRPLDDMAARFQIRLHGRRNGVFQRQLAVEGKRPR